MQHHRGGTSVLAVLLALLGVPATAAHSATTGSGTGAGQAATGPMPIPTPAEVATAMRRIAAEPYRYGGSVSGSVPGAATPADRPVHLSLGLDPPDPQGRLRGSAILFDRQRRLVALGPVTGRITGGPTAGTGTCTLHLALPAAAVSLSGLCTADALSGVIVSTAPRGGLLTRLVDWWGDRTDTGLYWLTPASFDPPS